MGIENAMTEFESACFAGVLVLIRAVRQLGADGEDLAAEFREHVALALEHDQERAAIALELFAQLAEADRKPHPHTRFTVVDGGKGDDQGPGDPD